MSAKFPGGGGGGGAGPFLARSLYRISLRRSGMCCRNSCLCYIAFGCGEVACVAVIRVFAISHMVCG